MNLTWRQLNAYLEFNDTIDRQEQGNALWVATIGAQGDDKMIKQAIRELNGQ